MDEKLINEYINNLQQELNAKTQEVIVLKTRLGVLEKEKEKLTETNEELDKELKETKFEKQEEEAANKPEVENEPKRPPKFIREPKPKGYNPKVDGPRKLIPNPDYNYENE
tara:strand:+ start:5715 stop:6047 length:333 start_codon:yes stop_codon:yes gene_type:complete